MGKDIMPSADVDTIYRQPGLLQRAVAGRRYYVCRGARRGDVVDASEPARQSGRPRCLTF